MIVRLADGRPARFQPGDLVVGVPHGCDGEAVGTVVVAPGVNADALDRGEVTIATADGQMLPAAATSRLTAAADVVHPPAAVAAITTVRVTCRCGKTVDGDTREVALARHRAHAKAACA